MTDQPLPLTDDDLSAALDGEADAATVARIAEDPAARARQAELAAAAALLRTSRVPDLDAASVDELVATALDTPVAPPASARRGPAPWMVAAVVAVLLAVGLGLIWSGRNGSEKLDTAGGRVASDASSSAETSNKSADTAALSGGSGDAPTTTVIPGHGPATTTGPSAPLGSGSTDVVALGSFATGDELRTALATSFPETAAVSSDAPETAPATPTTEAVDRCAAQVQVTLSLKGDPLHQGYATVGAKQVLVYEFASTSYANGSPTTLVAAVGAEACDQVVVFER